MTESLSEKLTLTSSADPENPEERASLEQRLAGFIYREIGIGIDDNTSFWVFEILSAKIINFIKDEDNALICQNTIHEENQQSLGTQIPIS